MFLDKISYLDENNEFVTGVVRGYRWVNGVVTYDIEPPTWEDLAYDVERAFDGQMKNLDRVWKMAASLPRAWPVVVGMFR